MGVNVCEREMRASLTNDHWGSLSVVCPLFKLLPHQCQVATSDGVDSDESDESEEQHEPDEYDQSSKENDSDETNESDESDESGKFDPSQVTIRFVHSDNLDESDQSDELDDWGGLAESHESRLFGSDESDY